MSLAGGFVSRGFNRYEEKFQKAYEFLNADQKRIVDVIDGPVMVVAGPGAGKTQVMSLRAANILRKTDVVPESVLCLTFTDSATKNLQKRLHKYIGNAAYDVSVFTFHGFAGHLATEFAEFFYEERDYKVVEELDQVLLLEKIFDGLNVDANLRKNGLDGGYLYMNDVKNKISQLKRAGLTSQNFRDKVVDSKQDIERMQETVGGFVDGLGRVTKKSINSIVGFFQEIQSMQTSNQADSWLEVFVREFAEMILELEETSSTKPFTAWKKKNIVKNQNKESVLKDFLRLQKNLELVEVYDKYCQEMDKMGWIDFDDLLMDVREKLKSDQAFLASVQERYLYVMVDEFQDTSGVQMDIVDMILSSELFGEHPNIMVVGDDDQSIYKFQGAKISNILKFKQVYPSAELIVLDKNYRSTQRILDVIRSVIVQGEDRLENHIESLTKVLKAGNTNLADGRIVYKEFAYELQEFEWIVEELKTRWLAGEDLSEIALIGRNHSSLRDLSKLLNQAGVPISYEHSKDILQSEIIRKIHKILAFVDMEYDKNHYGADDLLVDILCFDFWNLPRLEVWKLVRMSYDERLRIADLIRQEGIVGERVRQVVEFLFVLGQKAQEASVFEVLEFLLGKDLKELDENLKDWVCPLKEYYFRKDEGNLVSSTYIEFLMDLKTLFDRLKDYRTGKALFVKDVVDYLDAHIDHGLRINNNFNLSSTSKAVTLLTAHKSKGMEFETVYVISCNDDKWASKGRSDKLQLFNNIVVQSEPDENDDFLRLFYVALSRAKRNLVLSNFLQKSNGREVKPFRFLDTVLEEIELFDEVSLVEENKTQISEQAVELDIGLMLGGESLENVVLENEDERNFLLGLVAEFKLSVTAFNNFLNLSKGGPKYFLENNLLRFPQGKSVKSEYGTAMHKAISDYMILSKNQKSFAGVEKIEKLYEQSLAKARMTDKERKDYFVHGSRFLNRFYSQVVLGGGLDLDDLTELNFAKENVVLDADGQQVEITGAIDWVHFIKDESGEVRGLKVVDFKTGKELRSWDKSLDEFEKIKSWQYRNQLGFYDFLLVGHRRLSKYEHLESGLFFLESESPNPLLSAKLSWEELDRIKRLVGIVYGKIKALDFPDVSGYEANYMGTQDFINDLLEGKI